MVKENFKRLEDADYAYLAKYDRQLTTLLRARYLVGVGHTALEWMRDWWKRYTGNTIKVNENCANCVADFLDGVAKVYDYEKRTRAEEHRPRVIVRKSRTPTNRRKSRRTGKAPQGRKPHG